MSSPSLLELLAPHLLHYFKNFPFADILLTIAVTLFSHWLLNPSYEIRVCHLPFANNRKWYEIGYFKAKSRFLANGAALIKSGFEKV